MESYCCWIETTKIADVCTLYACVTFGTLPEVFLHKYIEVRGILYTINRNLRVGIYASVVQATSNFAEVQTIGAKDVLQLTREGEGQGVRTEPSRDPQ